MTRSTSPNTPSLQCLVGVRADHLACVTKVAAENMIVKYTDLTIDGLYCREWEDKQTNPVVVI